MENFDLCSYDSSMFDLREKMKLNSHFSWKILVLRLFYIPSLFPYSNWLFLVPLEMLLWKFLIMLYVYDSPIHFIIMIIMISSTSNDKNAFEAGISASICIYLSE